MLYELKRFFGCGNVYVNRRHDNHREDMFRWNVRSQADLVNRIIPFFEQYPLRTAKKDEFVKFSEVVRMITRHEHLCVDGLRRIAEIAQTMNHRKPSRYLESSEAIRQPTLLDAKS